MQHVFLLSFVSIVSAMLITLAMRHGRTACYMSDTCPFYSSRLTRDNIPHRSPFVVIGDALVCEVRCFMDFYSLCPENVCDNKEWDAWLS